MMYQADSRRYDTMPYFRCGESGLSGTISGMAPTGRT